MFGRREELLQFARQSSEARGGDVVVVLIDSFVPAGRALHVGRSEDQTRTRVKKRPIRGQNRCQTGEGETDRLSASAGKSSSESADSTHSL